MVSSTSSGPGDGPRERLTTHGAEALSEAELVALILRTGLHGCDALCLARRLLDHAGGLARLAALSPPELHGERGLGGAKVAALVAAFEIGRRVATRRLTPGNAVRGPEDVFRHFYARLRNAPQECFALLLLDGRHRLIREVAVSRGTLTASLVHPREVFRSALREAAAAVVLVHNHPSGDPTPSREDREVTHRLVRAGALIGIPVVDHVVVAEGGYLSLRQQGLFPEGIQSG
jgi:DNA repair protein RadC